MTGVYGIHGAPYIAAPLGSVMGRHGYVTIYPDSPGRASVKLAERLFLGDHALMDAGCHDFEPFLSDQIPMTRGEIRFWPVKPSRSILFAMAPLKHEGLRDGGYSHFQKDVYW